MGREWCSLRTSIADIAPVRQHDKHQKQRPPNSVHRMIESFCNMPYLTSSIALSVNPILTSSRALIIPLFCVLLMSWLVLAIRMIGTYAAVYMRISSMIISKA